MTAAVSAMNSPVSQNETTLTSTSTDNVNKEDFLRLLIAQLQHQDPLNPIENQEFVAELATFSSLEQQQTQTKLLEQLVAGQQNNATAQALSLIGKEATVVGNQFAFQPDEAVHFVFQAPQAGEIPVQVTDASGRIVYNDVINAPAPGEVEYDFDGKNAKGQTLTAGNYQISIGSTVDAGGNESEIPVYIRDLVDGVTFLDGTPILLINGQAAPLSDVQAVYERRNAA
ncbi:MAG: flagellar hook assembly protein FlgD [bacterium]